MTSLATAEAPASVDLDAGAAAHPAAGKDAETRRGPGRPRTEELDGQILAATLAIIDADEAVTVSRVVDRSGVSRAALYRRWPSMTTLIAAALDVGRTMPAPLANAEDLRAGMFEFLMGASAELDETSYPDQRFRQRIRLVMSDRALQQAYWESHVSVRRSPIEDALRAGVAAGSLRADLDVEACFDLIAGIFYYQLVVRGDRFDNPAARARCRAGLEVAWRGMTSDG
ncbi:TetR/AcrR family transcriptional regulator [Pseudoclavibacter sp. AY1F1]|uniref:TetR/AcrR family transcriptional regulator n=1 Tax=Pseudoclavibacter sp. AY1F1 TaxID=2080583 RepID=UPI0021571B2E|nr:TetR/AcrR family transcriptional regulator [Pseudoclavibacter sp. AY1F1]